MPSESTSVLRHTVAILDCFSNEKPELGVREVARIANLTPSTAGRLMAEMEGLGILSQNPTSRAYALGLKILTWSGVYMANLDLRSISLPFMAELCRITSETITLYVLDGNERLCIERMESPHNIRMVSRVGHRLPLYAGSAGKAILAFLPIERRERILETTSMEPLTPKTFTNRDALRKELETVRKQGYAASYGEWILEASGVAAPILGQGGEVIGALTISGPSARFTSQVAKGYAVEVVRVADQISRLMGFNANRIFLDRN